MALIIPMIDEQYEYKGQPVGTFMKDSINAVKKIKANYASYISQAATQTGVNAIIIIGFLAYENPAVNPVAISSAGAVGLGQITPGTVIETINLQLRIKDGAGLSPVMKQVIDKYLPGAVKNNKAISNDYSKSAIREALKKPEFNILITSLYIAQRLNWYMKHNLPLRLDHLVVMYNAGGNVMNTFGEDILTKSGELSGTGGFNKYVVKPGLLKVDTATLIQKSNLPLETKKTIIKFVGKNGTIHIQTQGFA